MLSSDIPSWVPIVGTGVNAFTGSAVAYAVLSCIQPLQAMAVSAVGNLVSQAVMPFFAQLFYGEDAGNNENLRAYVLSHIVSVPLVALIAFYLGLSMSGPGLIVLTVANVGAAILGLEASVFISKGTAKEFSLE